MAEIRVEPRRRTNVWLWLLVALVLVAIAVWLLYQNGMLNITAFGGETPWPEMTTATGATWPVLGPTPTT